jgi:endonuclease-3
LQNATLEAKRKRANQILTTLRANLTIREEDFATLTVAREKRDSFRILVVTVLTQSCTDIAALRAFRNLDRQVGVSVPKLAQANVRAIERAIYVAGLHREKAQGIKQLAKVIAERYSGNLAIALNDSIENVRAKLQELPRVGPKTADVLLSVWKRPTISVDTHVDRVSKRLGLAAPKARYEEVRNGLMQVFEEGDYNAVPILFMTHGRRYCRALRPLCPACPLGRLCPYPHKTRSSRKRTRNRAKTTER